MKHLKRLCLAAAAAALMVLAGSASATTLTFVPGTHTPAGATIYAASEGHATLDSPIGQIKCNSSIEALTDNTGGAGETVKATVDVFTFTGCTTATVHVIHNGTLELHSIGNSNGTVTSSGLTFTVETYGAHCIYATNNTDIGTLTGGTYATLDVSAVIPREGGKSGVFCGSNAPWTGSYKVTQPNPLYIS